MIFFLHLSEISKFCEKIHNDLFRKVYLKKFQYQTAKFQVDFGIETVGDDTLLVTEPVTAASASKQDGVARGDMVRIRILSLSFVIFVANFWLQLLIKFIML